MAINISPDNPMVSIGCRCAVTRYRSFTMTDVERSTRPRDRKAQLAAVAAELFRATAASWALRSRGRVLRSTSVMVSER